MDTYHLPFLGGINSEIAKKEISPSNENQEGKVWEWNPNRQRMEFRHPKILFGAGALDASTGNISLTNNTWVALYTAVPGDGIGFRSGMVGYLPKGRYGCWGEVAISNVDANITMHVRIRQGITEANPTTQPRIIGGAPITLVGGGTQTGYATANSIFTIPFSVTDIQCNMKPGYANEVWVEVYATGIVGASTAMSTSAQAGQGEMTHMTFIRWDGLFGTQ